MATSTLCSGPPSTGSRASRADLKEKPRRSGAELSDERLTVAGQVPLAIMP
jgi:hypothetical protein